MENGTNPGLAYSLIWLVWALASLSGLVLFLVFGFSSRFNYERWRGGVLTIRDVTFYFAWLQLTTMILMLASELLGVSGNGWFGLILPYLPHGLMILCALWLFKGRLSELDFRRMGAKETGFAFVAVIAAYGFTYFFLDPLVTNPVAHWFNLELGSWREESISEGINQAAKMGLLSVGGQILLIGVMGPIAEEILFRGLLMNVVARRMGVSIALIVSALLFACSHADVSYMAPLFVLGLLLGGLYAVFRSLWVPIFFHIVNNTASVLFDLFR
ncbi:CPBP family intramembrane glutamic endopeptidase [Marininema mesophilum]|uniref:CPBP family intramembrane glutamic endopeptidase n=1 Tax=Marininema mesophilum TaxID=1048340 RepID=UPI0015A6F0C4|nr:CPBP family intramembrane glutamic endopeptidase [Marininema mesophilum]